jgi:GNAT superfamily N-acetyltransferase
MNWQVTRCLEYEQHRYQVLIDGQELGRCWVFPGAPAQFSGLYVIPAWRGQGIARALVCQALADYASSKVCCHAAPFGRQPGLSRRALKVFYRRLGATVTRTGLCTWEAQPCSTG